MPVLILNCFHADTCSDHIFLVGVKLSFPHVWPTSMSCSHFFSKLQTDGEVTDPRKEANEMSGAQRADKLNIWRRAVTTVFLYNTGGSRSSGISGNDKTTLHVSKQFILIKALVHVCTKLYWTLYLVSI